MTTVTGDEVRAQYRDAAKALGLALRWLLFAIGWLLAKSCRAVAVTVGALLFGAGWLGGRAIRPALRWSGDAVRLGWQSGVRPGVQNEAV